MKRVVSVGLVLLLALGLVGLGTSLCREIMAKDFEVRAAPSCHDQSCCTVCMVNQAENPGWIEKTSVEVRAAAAGLLSELDPGRIFRSHPHPISLCKQRIVLDTGGEVYLLNAAFLI